MACDICERTAVKAHLQVLCIPEFIQIVRHFLFAVDYPYLLSEQLRFEPYCYVVKPNKQLYESHKQKTPNFTLSNYNKY